MKGMTLGRCILMDLVGLELSAEEKDMLKHPSIAGVILFARNYDSREQLCALTRSIRQTVAQPLLIVVDQEGGRVQRFRNHFTRLPSMRELGKDDQDAPLAVEERVKKVAWVMAVELIASGIDLSLAPVLDLDRNQNAVVGDRSFGRDFQHVQRLARCFMEGMSLAGMSAIAKHFPGHGGVSVDSHIGLPVDHRSYEELLRDDLKPFQTLIHHALPAVMLAHIVFPAVDNQPVCFSQTWTQKILRQQLGFQGIIFTDDLSMGALKGLGDPIELVKRCIFAGCDLLLLCNNRLGLIEVLDHWPACSSQNANEESKILHLLARKAYAWEELVKQAVYRQTRHFILEHFHYDSSPV